MDANRLRYFSVVARTSSIRKAAELLHLSPAALSKAIKQLEHETGFNLIIQSGRGILITEEGKDLAKKAQPLLDSLEGLVQSVRQHNPELGTTVRLGSFEVFTTHFLSPLLAALSPFNQILLRELIPGELENSLSDGEIDYGITYIPIPAPQIEHQKITSIDMGIFASEKFVRDHQKSTFTEIPFAIPIQPVKGSPTKVQGLDGWPEDRVPRQVRYRVTLMESALEICRQGLAAAYFPKFVIALHNRSVRPEFQLHEMPGPKGLGSQKQDLYISRRKTNSEDQIFKKIAKAVRMNCK